jgi:2OG-Fe(II) oxygenase superfamily
MIGEASTIPLAHVLYQRRWQVCQVPFPHIVAYDVFTSDFYSWLDCAYADLLERGLSETQDTTRFGRNIANYDAYSMSLSHVSPAPFTIFTSREWHDMITRLVGIRTTGDVNGGFHHHVPKSKTGTVHNDLNPGWFVDPPDPFQVNVARNELCSYSTGKVTNDNLRVHQTVRAIAILYYLHNPPWYFGQGGETGLYSHRTQPVLEPTKTIPPINNSLLLFECRPTSFHTFLSNRSLARNSLVMWLHRPVEDVVQRWGEKSIVRWTNSGPKNQPS